MMLSALTFLAACGLVASAIWRVTGAKGREVSGRAMALTAAVPAALICLCLLYALAAGRLGELRLAVSAIEANLKSPSVGERPGETSDAVFRIGGERRDDDLVVAGLPGGVLQLRSTPGQTMEPAGLELAAGEVPDEAAAVMVGLGRRSKLAFVGERPFADGDALCLSRCDAPSARWFVLKGRRFHPAVQSGGRWVAETGASASTMIPTRKALRLLTGIAFWTPAQAVHPLRDHLDPTAGVRGQAGCGSRFFCVAEGRGATPAKSFLMRKGGLFGSGWRLVLLDPDARYAPRGDPGRAPPEPKGLPTLAPGEARAVSLWEVRLSADRPTLDGDNLSRLVERRSFFIRNQDGRLALSLDTPDTLVVGGCTFGDLAAANLIGDPDVVSQGALELKSLGGATAAAAAGPLPLPTSNCADFTTAQPPLGDLATQDRVVKVRLDRMGFPIPMAAVAIFWAVISLLAQRKLWAKDRLPWVLVSVLQLLLAVRWLIAFAGAMADPILDWREIQAAAGAAYLLCPALFMLAVRPAPALLGLWVTVGIFILGALGGLMAWAGPFDTVTQGLIGGYFALLLAMMLLCWQPGLLPWLRGQAAGPGSERGAVGPWLQSVRAVAAESVGPMLAAWRRRAPPAWVLWLGLALLIRLGLGLLGFKERIGIAVSAIYTPLLILGFADLMDRAQRAGGRERSGLFLAFLGFYGVLIAVLPFAVHDIGYTFVMVAPFAAFPAVRALGPTEASIPSRLAWAAPASFAVFALVALLVAGAIFKNGVSDAELREAADPGRDNTLAIALLHKQADIDNNFLRLFAIGMPEWVASAGTAESENLRVWSAHLGSYTGSFFGRGYLSPSRLNPVIRPVQMDDNVSAVHLMSPFGRLGAIALLLLLAVLPLACARLVKPPPPDQPAGARIAGLLALWVMFGVAAYVILANLQLTPFTGRNVYLMAAKSGSDLVEGVSLFALAFWGLSRPGRTS